MLVISWHAARCPQTTNRQLHEAKRQNRARMAVML